MFPKFSMYYLFNLKGNNSNRHPTKLSPECSTICSWNAFKYRILFSKSEHSYG